MGKSKQIELETRDIASLAPAEFDRLHRLVRLNAKRVKRVKRWYDDRREI
jgi:hypothetical protein